ncbi:MAG: MFS transporter [Actinobacteria bacterium]|nr:MFS transporter [Actinomycetota bacterium]
MDVPGGTRVARRLPQAWQSPAGRGYILLAAMSLAFGLSMNTSNAVTTNYFADVLHFSGPQFGYITAIREVPGLLLIFITALLYRMSQQRLTTLALAVLAIGTAGYALATSFWNVLPWVVVGSLGFHTVLQTQVSLGMSLSEERHSGKVLGVMAGIGQGGALVGMTAVMLLFLRWPAIYHEVYVACGLIALAGGVAIVGFPHLHEGKPIKAQLPRQPFVLKRDYRYYYLLNVLDGARQQLFFSFGLWVLVSRFGLGVSAVSMVVIVSTVVAMVFSPWAGRMIDRHGERHTLSAINVAYIVALGGYALMGNVWLACVFYVLYSFIAPFSAIGSATYLRKIAVPQDIAPSLAMGVTLLHATAIVVPVAAGMVLNYVGYQVPFFIGCGFALLAAVLTLRLDPARQRTAAKAALDEAAGRGAVAG